MLSSRFLDALLRGEKRSTIRPGALKVAEEVYIHSRGVIAAAAKVERVVYKRVRDLTDEDARMDGFGSLEELLAELKRRYRRLGPDSIVTVVVFGEVRPLNEPEEAAYGGMRPEQIARLALKRLRLSRRERELLEAVAKYKSIRRAAAALFGDPQERRAIRETLKRAARELRRGGLAEEAGGAEEAEGASEGRRKGRERPPR